MMDATEIKEWLDTLEQGAAVAIDEGGLMLIHVGAMGEHLAHLEVGGVPSNICDLCGADVPQIMGCPDGAEICKHCFNAGQH